MSRARNAALLLLALVVAGGCAGRSRHRLEPPPRATLPPERSTAPRAATAAPANTFPGCDPRYRDPDRGRVGMGLMASDCQDARGRNGVFVTRLVAIAGTPSPAQKGGVRVGDRLVKLDACEVGSTHDLGRQLRSAPSGWVARVVVERGTREMALFVATVDLAERIEPPAPQQLSTAGCQALGRKPAK